MRALRKIKTFAICVCKREARTYAENLLHHYKRCSFSFSAASIFFKKKTSKKSHRWRKFCVSCDYLFLIWKATVWHVVAAQKYIILWQIATFNNKNSLQVNWGTVTVLPLGTRKRRGKRRLEPSHEWMKALKPNTKENEQENGQRQQLVYVVCWPI